MASSKEIILHLQKRLRFPFNNEMDETSIYNVGDFINQLFKSISVDERTMSQLLEIIFLSKISKVLNVEVSKEIRITQIFPLDQRVSIVNDLSYRLGFKMPRLVMSTFGFIVLVITFLSFFLLVYYFLFTNTEFILVIPLVGQLVIAVIVGIVPVMIIGKVFPSLFAENRFYYIKNLGDFVKETISINRDMFLSENMKILYQEFSDFIRSEISNLTNLPDDMIDSVPLSTIKLN